jgi:hypothetical protein
MFCILLKFGKLIINSFLKMKVYMLDCNIVSFIKNSFLDQQIITQSRH